MNKLNKSCKNKGLTLLELVIALGLWAILSASVFFLWQHTSGSSLNMLERQSAFERARGSMDTLIINAQMADEIIIVANPQNQMERITFWGLNPSGQRNDYIFEFLPGTQVLRLGGQEFASNIAAIYVTHTPGRRMNFTIHTGCNEPIVLHSSVDVRYKLVYP